ncbi:hypothetical protein VO64_0045 [Pseudomonas synxantha]|uniref:Uncharacterized protein n=1 Tax=Pseudomonas synxantha TaxID=47883 RepID=A0AAU8TIY3_9PSED|nr:hypothetical protein VO64_0045 [Pseudomonas synxantha]
MTKGHRAALRSSVCEHPCRETIRQRQRTGQTLVTTVVVLMWAYIYYRPGPGFCAGSLLIFFYTSDGWRFLAFFASIFRPEPSFCLTLKPPARAINPT